MLHNWNNGATINKMQASSTPVVFLPGTLCDERVWLPLWKQLADINRRYVPLQWATSLDDMLALTADRIEGEKVHLVGYSMGGFIATLYAIKHSQNIASLTLIGYDPAGLGQAELKRREQITSQKPPARFNPHSAAFIQHFIHPDFLQSDSVVSSLTDMASDLGMATLKAQTQATTQRPSMLNALKDAPFPVHVIGASGDNVVPETDLRRSIDCISPSSHHIIDGAGHMMLLEKPDEVAALLQKWITVN